YHQRQRDKDRDPDRHKDDAGGAQAVRDHRALPPPRPVGLKARVRSSMANTTINPESAPTYWMPNDSATPIIRLAIKAPITLPSVPSTTATKAISTNTCPTNG